jgi:hypothetical protein
MVKVLIYSSKEIYDKAPYEGRAEAHIVAYRRDDDHTFEIIKNRTKYYMSGNYTTYRTLALDIRSIEQTEWEEELKDYQTAQRKKLTFGE